MWIRQLTSTDRISHSYWRYMVMVISLERQNVVIYTGHLLINVVTSLCVREVKPQSHICIHIPSNKHISLRLEMACLFSQCMKHIFTAQGGSGGGMYMPHSKMSCCDRKRSLFLSRYGICWFSYVLVMLKCFLCNWEDSLSVSYSLLASILLTVSHFNFV